jgi:hypothetical protein
MNRGGPLLIVAALIAGFFVGGRLAAGNAGFELPMRWNLFARHANAYIQVLEANPAKRQQNKDRLNREWEALYRCECF